MESYEYKPLNGRRSIRLLSLQPGTDSEVVIELQDQSLDDQPSYEALSYTWHTPEYEGLHKETIVDNEPTDLVVCDGRLIHVTPNCKDALLQLRLPDGVRVLWVDAICINQEDIPERNQQVVLMQNIYAACKRVLCWIGNGGDSIGVLFDYMKLFIGRWRECERMYELHGEETSGLEYQTALSAFYETRSAILGPYSEAQTSPLFSGIASLQIRSYWDRVWILQEIKSAPDALLLCGPHEISYKDFDDFFLEDFKLNASVEKRDLFHQKRDRSWVAEFMENFRIQSLVVSDDDNRSALETLIDGVEFLSTDPRDKIFGLLGLSHQLRELVTPDYSQTTSQVYTKVAASILEQMQTLDLLYQCFGQACQSDLPSWVPDWSAAQRSWRRSQSGAAKRYNAAGGLPAMFEIHDRNLTVKGLVVDTVSAVTERIDEMTRNMAESVREKELQTERSDFLLTYPYKIRQQWCQLANSCRSEPWVSKSDPESDSLWYLFNAILQLPDLHHGYEVWREILEHKDFTLVERAKWIAKFDKTSAFDRATSRMKGLTLCTTAEGRLGLVPEVVQTGDKVVIIAGCSLPFAVRPIPDGYKLIGASFVHGLMDGEAMTELDRLENITLGGETDLE